VIDISNSSSSAGAVEEASCIDAECSGYASPYRATNAGVVATAPEPSSALLVGMTIILLGFALKRSTHSRL
jgi:hypothetical protein